MSLTAKSNKLLSVYYGLSESEVERAHHEVVDRLGPIEFRAFEIKPSSNSTKYYQVFIRTRDWPTFENHVAEIYEVIRPFSEQVRIEEESIARLIEEMHDGGSLEYDIDTRSPMYRLCLHLEWKTGWCFFSALELQKILDYWCDGFYPETAKWLGEHHLQFSGHCWVGRGSDASETKGPFCARVWADPESKNLGEFELRFADTAAMAHMKVISEKAPTLIIQKRGDYQIIARKSDESSEPQFAFEVLKIGPS